MNSLGALVSAAASASTPGPATSGSAAADPASPGFAGLFALLGGFGQAPASMQSEPTALPLQALGAQDAESASPPFAEEAPDPAQPDPALLAALGLPPLPVEPVSPPPIAADGVTGLPTGARGLPGMALQTAAPDALAETPQVRVLGAPGEGIGALEVGLADLEEGATAFGRRATPVAPAAIATPPLAGAPPAGALPSASAPAANELPTASATAASQPPRAGADFSGTEPAAPPRMPGGTAAESAPAAVAASALPLGPRSTLSERAAARIETSAPVGFERPEGLFREATAQHTVQAAQAAQAALQPRMEPGSNQFGAQLGQQLLWMGQQKIGRAEIRLDPAELGPLTIELEMDGDDIRAEFSSRSAEVRTLIDSQVPRLRELLAEQGFSLADAQVGQGRSEQRSGQPQSPTGTGASGDTGTEQDASLLATAPVRVRQGLVDDYA